MISSLDLGDVAMEEYCICSKLLRYIIMHKKKKKENKKVWLSIIRAKMLSNPFLIIIISIRRHQPLKNGRANTIQDF
jgi:hypothetical protein